MSRAGLPGQGKDVGQGTDKARTRQGQGTDKARMKDYQDRAGPAHICDLPCWIVPYIPCRTDKKEETNDREKKMKKKMILYVPNICLIDSW